MADLNALARAKLDELCQSHPTGKSIRLEFRPFRTTAGRANYRDWVIQLSGYVLDTEEKLMDTLVHEYAHLLAIARHGVRAKGHGEPWRACMRELGASPTVKHTYECVRNERRQQVVYRCAKCGIEISRHRRLPRKRKYLHSGCGGEVVFSEMRLLASS